MTSIHDHNKRFISGLRAALYDCEPSKLSSQLSSFFAPDCKILLAYPFDQLDGPKALFDSAYQPLITAVPDLERRDFIVMAGESNGENWIGCGGYYMGLFEKPWMDIPATGHMFHMRYHEFFKIVDDQIVEMQALWDIPEVMMMAKAWPLVPSLGVEWVIPGPATQDGIIPGPYDKEKGDASIKLVFDMLALLKKNQEGVEAMKLDRYWHPKMMWYGPAGIGSMRRISGFRNWHQAPFLKAMPNRNANLTGDRVVLGDGEYVGFTAWPGMTMTHDGDGWLGIPPMNKEMTMLSLDFWRCENGLIRENWVLVDILDVYRQLGVDVFERMRELTQIRL